LQRPGDNPRINADRDRDEKPEKAVPHFHNRRLLCFISWLCLQKGDGFVSAFVLIHLEPAIH
jgi:hypothetical protein